MYDAARKPIPLWLRSTIKEVLNLSTRQSIKKKILNSKTRIRERAMRTYLFINKIKLQKYFISKQVWTERISYGEQFPIPIWPYKQNINSYRVTPGRSGVIALVVNKVWISRRISCMKRATKLSTYRIVINFFFWCGWLIWILFRWRWIG